MSVIMLVDDDEFSLMVVGGILEQYGEIETAEDGQQALDFYKSNYSNIKYIVMDIYMPVLDGYEATKKIREFEKAKGLPRSKIVGCSADDDQLVQKKVKESGMDGLLVKPVNQTQLTKLNLT